MGILIEGILGRPKDLVTLAKEGEKEAFAELIEEVKDSLYRVAKSILKDEELSYDAISNTIVKAYINIKKLKKNSYFKTWIIKILINECNDILKERKNISYFDNLKDSGYVDKYEDIDLQNAINSLSEEFKIVVLLYYFEDMGSKDIAKTLDLNETTVRTRLNRAKGKLYKILKEKD